MRTRKKPVKRRFLALFLCLSMVISMMNVGGNVWADEKTDTAEMSDETGGIDQSESRDEAINPQYTIQHYFWFPQVEMESGTDQTGNNNQLKIINTDNPDNAGSDGNQVNGTFGEGNLPDNTTSLKMLNVTMDVQGTTVTKNPAEGSTVLAKGKVKTTNVLTKMFEDEEVLFLEKPRMIYMNRLYNGDGNYNENYALQEVWVYEPEDDKENKNIEDLEENDFDIYIAPLNKTTGRYDPSKFIFTNNPKNESLQEEYPITDDGKYNADSYTILIKEGTVIRLVFRTTENKRVLMDGVKFFDYDISDGGIYSSVEEALGQSNKRATSEQTESTTWYSNTIRQGINGISLGEDTNSAIYAFGNNNTGTTLGEQSWQWNSEGNRLNINMSNKSDGSPDAVFGMVTGLSPQGTLVWHENIKAPAIFDQNSTIDGKTNYLNDFGLIFHREGGTYTLSGVQYNGEDIASAQNLETFTRREYRPWSGDTNKVIWSNNFWPMDAAPSFGAEGHDLKFGMGEVEGKYYEGDTGAGAYTNTHRQYVQDTEVNKSINFPIADDALDHNSYFGMTFDVDFVVDPGYVAPLRYFFYGDDDLWVFLSEIDENGNIVCDESGNATTKLIADIGGVHSSIGEYVDLWDYIEPIEYKTNGIANSPKTYRLSFYYTERGASGSTCYMRFSVPFKSLQTDPIVFDSLLKIEKQVESQNFAGSIDENREFEFILHLYNEDKTELVNQYAYERYDKDGNTITKTMDTMTTGSVFKLRDGEYIIVKDLPKGTTYAVEEKSDSDSGIFTTFCIGSATTEEGLGKELTIGNEAQGNSEGTNYVKFINSLNPGILTLEKKLSDSLTPDDTEFKFNIKLEKENVFFEEQPWLHYIEIEENGKSQYVWKEEISQCNNGEFTLSLKAGEKAMLYNLPEETHYTINEDPNDNYNLEKVTIDDIEVADLQKIEGDIGKSGDETGSKVNVIFTNSQKGLKIEKEQSVLNKSERTKDLLKVEPGDEVTYYLTVTNTSDTTAFDVEVKDTVPEDDAGNQLELIENSIEGGNSHSISGRTITWNLGNLAPGESKTVQFTVIVPEGGTYWINGGSTSYIPPDPGKPDEPGPDRTPDIPSNEVEIEKPGISIQKTQYAGDDAAGETDKLLSVKPGDVITYCLTVTNGSDKDAADVIVTDQIPDGLTLVSGSVSDGGTVGSDGVITWKLGTLEAHDSKKVQFKVTVPQVDKAAKWTNIAYVTSGDPDPDPEEDPKTPSNPVEAIPGIKIEKAQQLNGEGEPTKELLHVKADDQVTYYLTVTNTSDATAFDVEVKDTVPEDDAGNQLELIESSVEGGNSHSISGRTITWKLGDLKAGESRTVQFTVIVPEGGTYWINGGSTSYIPPDPEDPEKPGPEEDRTPDIPSNEVEIEKPEISIRKTQYAGDDAAGETDKLLSVKPGDVITYCLTVTNGSDKDAADVIVTDQIPDGLTLVSGSVSDGGTVGSDRVITWKLGTLEAHDSKKVQFKVTVPQVDKAAKWTNIAYVTSGDPDPDPEEDPKTPSNPVEAIPGIEIEKTQQLNGEGEPTKELLHVKAGDQVTYYLTVTNTSDATAFDVKVTDTIPTDNAGNELQLVAGSVKGGTGHEISGREITWSLGNLNPGDKSTVEFTVTVPAGGTHWINGASANYIPPDPEEPDKPGPEEERTPDIPSNEVEIDKSDADIVIRKLQSLNGGEATKDTLNVKPGDVITYRLAVSNESDNPADDVIVTDPVPAGLILDEDSIVPEGIIGTGQNGQQTITWKLGTLEAGEEKTLEFKVTVPQSDKAAKWTNIAYVTEGDPDPDPEDPKTPSNEVEAVPGIEIEKTQQVNGRGEPTKETLQVQKGDEVTYYLTVTNTSETKAFDVIVTDEIPDDGAGNRLELVEGSVEGGESHKVSGNVITWNIGDLEAGESRQVKFTVKVPVSGSSWKNMASTSYVPGDPEDPEKPGPEEDRTPDIPSNEVEIQAGTTKIQLRARKVLNGAELLNGQFTFRIQGISADITEEAENETQKSETARKPEESEETPEATPSNAERVDDETTDSGNSGVLQGLSKPIGTTITKQVMLQAGTLAKGEGIRVGSYAVPMPSSSTATNNEDGEIVFGEIEYTVPGIYIYKISEVKEMRTGYTFDTTEYTVEVVVSRDEATGELTAEVRIVKPEGADEILFTNRYRRPSSGGSRPGGGGGSNPQPGPGTDPTPDNPDVPDPDSPSLEDPQPDTETPGLPDPNDPNSPDRVTIDENGVPRTYVKVWDPEKGEYIYIPEEDVPLYGLLPKTGEEDRRRRLEMILALSLAGVGALTMEERRRRKKEQKSK